MTNQKWRPSAEFVESALIFTYGATNVFLEHLGSTDNEYSAEDLEHVSITVLFIGGGLVGCFFFVSAPARNNPAVFSPLRAAARGPEEPGNGGD